MPMPDIINAAFSILADGLLTPIIFPNATGTTIPTEQHLRAYILPADTETVGLNSWNVERGIIQISVYDKVGVGVVAPYTLAEEVLALFPRGLVTSAFKVHRAGSIGPAVIDGGWVAVAVSIPYENVR